MKHDNITKCIAWITICIAVLAGLYWTKSPSCLWAFWILLLI
nr:MAG TPA: hypothetical protein [Caudoviricetes sp.]